MRKFFAFALLIAALGACVAEIGPRPPAENSCGAASLQGLVGQGESVLAAITFAQPVRFIHPTTPVTMDYRSDRLNILIDATGFITDVRCG